MKKILTSITLALAAVTASASATWDLMGTTYTVDTLFHNQVGPGTMQTSLWFHAGTSQLRVFYTEMDMTNQYLSLRGVCAKDMLAGNERISGMAERKSAPGQRYFIGVNADFFSTSGTTARGVSIIGSPVGSTVVDGTIFRARNNATNYKNFVVDYDGNLYCNPFNFAGTVKDAAGNTAKVGSLNAPYTKNNITIFNDRYYGSTSQSVTGTCVTARVAEGYQFTTTGDFKLVVTGAPEETADATIPDGEYVLFGHGTAASLVANLKVGDEVTVNLTWTYDGKSVNPYQIISGNPKILADGVVLNSEADRGDANSQQPRAAVGYSHGGDKAYFFVVDGRSPLSAGVRTMVLADIMRYAGVTDAMNVDGGGSAVLYTSTLGIRNKPSDGSERADGNGFYCVSSAPDDSIIASIRFVDYKLNTPKYGLYTPKFYGYNQYGMLIDQDVQGVTLTCDESVGVIKSDTTFFGTGEGKGLLTAHYGEVTLSEEIFVGASVDDVKIKYDSIVTDGFREYPIDVESTVMETVMPIDPSALEWTSSDPAVVAVGAHTGVLKGVADGEALVVGTLNGRSDTIKVVVQKPTAHAMPIDPDLDINTWKFSQAGGKDAVKTAVGDGFTYEYTGSSSRAPKLTMSKDIYLWSLPDTLRVRLNPGEAPVKSLVFGLRTNGGGINYQTVAPEVVNPNVENTFDVPMNSWMDTDDMGNFPVLLSSIQVGMGASATGQKYVMNFMGLETIYNAIPLTPVGVKGDVNGDGVVDINDANILINAVLGKPYKGNADVTGDGTIDISDVNFVVNAILGKNK
ncbi:phosphodiester glycosidase family protein [Sodaliphilus sp.]|uniref:phosphodiester glycosidase family protein n=1 Tax=Sodaliphilus sp. TaxID=2815818 RepID=UPI00388F3052